MTTTIEQTKTLCDAFTATVAAHAPEPALRSANGAVDWTSGLPVEPLAVACIPVQRILMLTRTHALLDRRGEVLRTTRPTPRPRDHFCFGEPIDSRGPAAASDGAP
jgi:hypothetical protein